MIIFGLTGSSGSGKSKASSFFHDLGATILDADKIYADLLLNCDDMKSELDSHFNVLKDGKIDRKLLASIVFSDSEKLKTLNQITHKYVSREFDLKITEAYSNCEKFIILDVPLLFESGLDKKCDKNIGVICDYDTKIKRIMKRDNITYENATARLKNQPDNDFYSKNCDIIIENNSTEEILFAICKKIAQRIGD